MEEDIATRTPPGTSYHVGCASWLDTSLLAEGTFYPSPHMTAEERLRWYARFFEAVEVNATYYALPAYDTSRAWVERTPPGFQFAVKAYSLMTGHHPKAQALVKELRALLPRDAPMNARGEVERQHFSRAASASAGSGARWPRWPRRAS